MNSELIEEKIRLAKELVKNEDEPYKLEAFKIILSELLKGTLWTDNVGHDRPMSAPLDAPQNQEKADVRIPINGAVISENEGKSNLAKRCDLTIEQLDDIISITKNKEIHLISRFEGSEAEKQTKASLCILLAYETILGTEWLPSETLSRSLDLSNIGSLQHMGENLSKKPDQIKRRGNKRATEYKISGPGRESAISLMQKLAKNEHA